MKNLMKLPFIKMFSRKRKTSGAVWASLAGLGISAAVFGLTRGKKKVQELPFKNMMNSISSGNKINMMNNIKPGNKINMMDNAALAEFSEELMESALKKDKY